MNEDTIKLANSILEWWKDHKSDSYISYDGEEYNIFDDEPEFVIQAKHIIELKKEGTPKEQLHKPNLRHVAAEIIQSNNLYNEVSNQLECTTETLRALLRGHGCFTNEQAKKICEILKINPVDIVFRWED